MRTRTWLTTPPGQAPGDGDDAWADRETYVSVPDLPIEPRVPGRHRRTLVVLLLLVLTVAVVTAVVSLGQRAQREDPSIPEREQPADGERPADGEQPLELPES